MSWPNFHTHCDFDHGLHGPDEYVKAAVERGMPALGFSCHAPMPLDVAWAMRRENLPDYMTRVRELQSEYRGRIDLSLGLEIDYLPGVFGPGDPGLPALDYCIGSVHFLGAFDNAVPWAVDENPDTFEKGLKEIYDDSVEEMATLYYQTLQWMVRRSPPDIVGHLDLVKKNNVDGLYFSESEPWYQDAVEHLLRDISQRGVMVEINTGGITRGYMTDVYPSFWILKRCRQLGIPVTLGADAHAPDQVCGAFDLALDRARAAGYASIRTFAGGRWRNMEI